MPISEETRLRYEQMNERRAKFGLPPEELPEDEPVRPVRRLKAVPPSTPATPVTKKPKPLPPATPSTRATPGTHDTPERKARTDYRPGDSRVNNDFFDDRLCGLDPLAQLLYFHLNRYRRAGTNLTVVVSWNRLEERIPVTASTLRRAYKRLRKAGLVFKEKDVYSERGPRGMIFRVVTGATPSRDATPVTGATHKSNDLKDNDKREISNQERMSPEELLAHMERLEREGK